MSRVLIIAEHNGTDLSPGVAKCVSCAAEVPGAEIDIVVLADGGAHIANQAAAIDGVSKILLAESDSYAHQLAAVLAPRIVKIADEYTHVFAPSTTFGKDLLPRVAALLGVDQLSDIMKVNDAHEFERPIYAGNVVVTVAADSSSKVVATVRTASYEAADGGNSASIETINVSGETPTHTRFIEKRTSSSDRPELQTAAVVVSGGRALGSDKNFELIYGLADSIGAAVGASRAAVDAGYVSNDLQVGQTGKIIAPRLYVAIGISGAIQHLTGIKDAGTIIAINKDEEAPIFEVADIGLVGDLFEIVPELQQQLSSAK